MMDEYGYGYEEEEWEEEDGPIIEKTSSSPSHYELMAIFKALSMGLGLPFTRKYIWTFVRSWCTDIAMETQNQIKRILTRPESIEQINALLDTNNLKRTELADQVCEQFGFFDPRGEKQRAGCLKALRELEKRGQIVLPEPTHNPGVRSPRRLNEAIPEPCGVPDTAGDIRELRLIMVETEEHMRIWNELMIRDHPRGATLLVGRQIRYLVGSEHGWLGGLGFSSAALQLEDRDRWIGWDLDQRRANLHFVLNMNRFLIRPSVSCRNLASHVLGMALRRLPLDFEARYGYRPLLVESFVDTEHFKGTCYQAANWERIGRTKGRGRQDRLNEKAETVKEIYVYPLEKDFRHILEIPEASGSVALDPAAGIDEENWAENEFGGAPLGDKRLSQRLVEAADAKAKQPGVAFSGVASGDWPKVKGYYRMIDKPDDSAVSMSNILLPHRNRTIQRMKAQEIVLCTQDGCDLNYATLDKCEGLGVIGANQTSTKSRGLHLHSTFVTTTDGLPLGVLRAECTAPEPKSEESKQRSASLTPIEEKKTFTWIEGMRDCSEVKAGMPGTSIVCIMDREADFFELFDEHRSSCSNIDLIVRAHYDRKTAGESNLFETIRESFVQSRLNIQIPRQSAKPKKGKQEARPERPARTAEVSLRFEKVEITPPKQHKGKDSIQLTVVHVLEETPPAGTDPLEWFLLTTMQINTVDDALNCVKWYRLRWRIEDWHRVLKSGCGVEKIAHKTAERLKRAIAINLVIAWRIMLMTLLGRETPELPQEVIFSDLEIKVLAAYAKKKHYSSPNCLGEAVKLVAKLGGYLARANDPPPGHQIMWKGYAILQLMCEGFELGIAIADTT